MTLLATYESIGAGVWQNWLPRRAERTIDWLRENVRMPDGGLFDLDLYPHIGAPGGPAEAFDDDYIRTIWLMWATRLGKTAFALSLQLFIASQMPAPMIFGTNDSVAS